MEVCGSSDGPSLAGPAEDGSKEADRRRHRFVIGRRCVAAAACAALQRLAQRGRSFGRAAGIRWNTLALSPGDSWCMAGV
ncbi:hypothetical protein BURMUCF1_0643 [Burkholderia multivorans ATCC BAA-247]|nr:hypothetical protein BURMUCF1_0643 [Burkholderia multivorans ATCC BAA-247]